MARRFRLVVTDLDGTLFDDRISVSEETRRALQDVIGPDCPLVIATARGINEGIPYEDMPGPLFVVALGGAHILERTAKEDGGWILHELFLEQMFEEQARAAVAVAEQQDATIWLCQTDKTFVRAAAFGVAETAKYLHSEPIMVDSLEAELATNRTVEVCAVVPNPDAGALYARHELAGKSLEVLSMAPAPLFTIKAGGVDKATALQKICNILGISREEIVAFGDGANDAVMLRFAGLGIAVGNAGSLAREAADMVSVWTNNQDAVGQELRKLRAEGQI